MFQLLKVREMKEKRRGWLKGQQNRATFGTGKDATTKQQAAGVLATMMGSSSESSPSLSTANLSAADALHPTSMQTAGGKKGRKGVRRGSVGVIGGQGLSDGSGMEQTVDYASSRNLMSEQQQKEEKMAADRVRKTSLYVDYLKISAGLLK